ncbi:amino acid ABC transporter ATP-binding protein [Shinella zoogloeoides]|uniref:amino acid ABC transporter ATP-binding protein n=1 Tax=Shinella zoogloeoides TaxID=352475 RepID=UPI0028A8F4F5|nr:amino acid ABC transporter ATP-binding protein [Shinella zoogloeoides]
MSIVQVQSITKRFGAVTVLDDVSLDVADGEVVAIIGRSGSGKSTMLRCINGLEPIQGGAIQAAGHRVAQTPAALRALRQDVGMIFQSFNLFPHLSALENVALPQIVVKRSSKEEAREAAAKLLERVGLTHRMHAFPAALSGGQQQRVAIARALALNPKILLCDEITSALDPEMVGEVLDVVRDLAVKGMTMLLVTHEMRFARDAATRIVFMHAGKVHEEGPPDVIFSRPVTPELRQFIKTIGMD